VPRPEESGLLRADSDTIWSTFLVSNPTGPYPSLTPDTAGTAPGISDSIRRIPVVTTTRLVDGIRRGPNRAQKSCPAPAGVPAGTGALRRDSPACLDTTFAQPSRGSAPQDENQADQRL
jgi:hypothetical protein